MIPEPVNSATRFFLSAIDFASLTGNRKTLLYGLLLAIAYFFAAQLGLTFAVVSNSVTLIWPPTGLALFALLVFGVHLWPAVLLGALAANLMTGVPTGAALAIAIGNCLEALMGFYLLRAAGFHIGLQRIRDVVILVVLAAGISTMFSATLGTLSLYYWQVISGDHVAQTWLTWWTGDAMGDLVFAPLLLAWWHKEKGQWEHGRVLEATLLLLCLVTTTQIVFGGQLLLSGRPPPIAFTTVPILVWAALRFGMRGATTATLIIGSVAFINIVHGQGLFAQGSTLESLLLLWLYTNVLAVTSMVLAAAVNERRLIEAGMRHLAQHDPLTGLPNRMTLQDRLGQTINHAQRQHCQVAVLFVDIDRFKIINDTQGHAIGDQFLVQVANRLRQCVRKEDTVSRPGGDEFVVVLNDITHSDDAIKVAEKILADLREPFTSQGVLLHSTASLGISLYPHDGLDTEALLTHADIAMYRAKSLGRNGFAFYSPDMNSQAVERLDLENRLRDALARDEFRLHYQAQYDAKTGRVVGAEALLRWQKSETELAAPDTFIAALEEMGLINAVGIWVLETACEQLAQWHARGWTHLRMSINVSCRQFSDAQLPQQVRTALAKRHLAPQQLELEITESMLVRQDAITEHTLDELVKLGVRLAVDDFGTGYSSLSYLHRLSIDTLKIDRAFVTDIPGNENSAAIAQAIIGMGKSLHLDLVAEGVETMAQHIFLRDLGCQMVQGFLFSRPIPAEDFMRLVESNRTACS